MNNTDKIAEARRVQAMLEDFTEDKADEINARVWCLISCKNYNHGHFLAYGYRYAAKFTTSLDACMKINPDGWGYGVQKSPRGDGEAAVFTEIGKPNFSIVAQTATHALLHAILSAYVHIWEGE